ncbi:MAG: 4Fe-4S dicluster domain-containing protein [Chloroflexi bacterium]|nr:4Fe-4S dicluster domain-containing protein [Chloroflexota bacterium]
MLVKPILDEALCNGCGLCVDVCRCGALVLVKKIIKIIEAEDCGYCTQCELVCPTGAIQCPFEIVIEETIEIGPEE